MADTATSTPPATDSKGKKGGIKAFIKKNKTLSAVLGAGGIYFLWKMRQEPAGEVHAIGEEGEPVGEGAGLGGTAELAAYEVGRAERGLERSQEDQQEIEDDKDQNKRHQRQNRRRSRSAPADALSPCNRFHQHTINPLS